MNVSDEATKSLWMKEFLSAPQIEGIERADVAVVSAATRPLVGVDGASHDKKPTTKTSHAA